MESLQVLKNWKLRDPSTLPIIETNAAVMGVLQELNDQTICAKSRIQDRYSHHALTSKGFNVLQNISTASSMRNIGQTEIKWVPTDILLNNTIAQIYVHGIKYLRLFKNISAFVAITSVPSYELVWFPLVLALHKASRLSDIIVHAKHIYKYTPSMSYVSPESASIYLGTLAFHIFRIIPLCREVVCLSYYDNFRYNDLILPYCHLDRWKYYYLTLRKMLNNISYR